MNDQGDVVGNLYIFQNFTGLSKSDNALVVETHITGSLPKLGVDEQVIYPDYNQNYMYKSNFENPLTRKVVESHGSITYKVRINY